ncbi:SRPBCC family protein [Candidatus Poriferisocius sp.]|uniref:SRPBCC family protein n=1 Tax=Candidatus Poriferisocius sp. TaxID=3101276 RepID=UPI003B01D4B1
MQTISSSTPIAAPQQVAWEVMTEHELYARWVPRSQVSLEVEGSPERNGVGAIRVFHIGPVRTREEMTAFDPPQRMAYRVLTIPLPVRNCRSDLLLVADDDGSGCTLHWDSWFETVIPLTGGIMRQIMGSVTAKMAAGIAEEAQLRAQSA